MPAAGPHHVRHLQSVGGRQLLQAKPRGAGGAARGVGGQREGLDQAGSLVTATL